MLRSQVAHQLFIVRQHIIMLIIMDILNGC